MRRRRGWPTMVQGIHPDPGVIHLAKILEKPLVQSVMMESPSGCSGPSSPRQPTGSDPGGRELDVSGGGWPVFFDEQYLKLSPYSGFYPVLRVCARWLVYVSQHPVSDVGHGVVFQISPFTVPTTDLR